MLAQEKAASGNLKEILGESSVLQIGKANWGDGEYYQGLLDDFTVYNYAFGQRDIDILEGKIVNPKPLKEQILEAKVVNKDYYTEGSYSALQAAIKAARKAVDTVTSKAELDEAMRALQAAVDGLERLPLNDAALTNKIAEAKAIEKGNYTNATYSALQTAIEEAEKAKDNALLQEELDAALTALQTAIDGLISLDVSSLTNLIAQAKTIQKGDYTDESYGTLQAAILTAEGAAGAVETEDALQAAVKALQEAIDGLKKKDSGNSGKPGEPGNPGNPGGTQSPKPLSTVKTVKAVQQTTGKAVKVSFGKVSGAVSYDIYRSTKAKSGYKKIANTRSASYVDKKVSAAKTYYYKVLARAKKADSNSKLSTKYAKVKVLAAAKSKLKASQGRKITVSWKKIKGAKGYAVYASSKKSKGFKVVKTLKKVKSVKTTIRAKKNVKKLYVKVRPYYMEGKKKIYGPYSKIVSVSVKK